MAFGSTFHSVVYSVLSSLTFSCHWHFDCQQHCSLQISINQINKNAHAGSESE